MNKSSCLLILSVSSLAMLPVNAVGDTYKCRAPDGKISYANQMPMTPGIKCEQMFVKKPPMTKGEDEASAPASEQAAAPAGAEAAKPAPQKTPADKNSDPKQKKAEADAAKKKADEEKLANQKLKEDNCRNAKSNYNTYQTGRIRKTSETGEYIYLNDAEVKQNQEQAKQEVDKWCTD
jgi:hypothetical protein